MLRCQGCLFRHKCEGNTNFSVQDLLIFSPMLGNMVEKRFPSQFHCICNGEGEQDSWLVFSYPNRWVGTQTCSKTVKFWFHEVGHGICHDLLMHNRSLGTLRRGVFQSVLDDIKDFSDQPIALASEMFQAAGPQTDKKLGYSRKLGEIFITKKSVDAAVSENALKHQAAMKIMGCPGSVDWMIGGWFSNSRFLISKRCTLCWRSLCWAFEQPF